MKKILCLLSILLFFRIGHGQDDKLKSTYDRSSLSWLLINDQGIADFNLLAEKLKTLNELSKYDINPLSKFLVTIDNQSSGSEVISNQLYSDKFANQILDYWFNRKADGSMSPDIFLDRGLYNAKDEDIIRSKAMKRGIDYVKDYGENLIGKSHVIVIKVDNIVKIEENNRLDQIKSLLGNGKFRLIRHNYRGYVATISAYLYRINFDQTLKDQLYNNCWVNPDDNDEVKKQKVARFNELNVGFTFVKKTTFITKSIKAVQSFPLNIFIRKPSYEKLMVKLSSKIQDETITELSRDYGEFEVKVPIHNVNPIVAKVGKKEGLRPDDRYFVYEYSVNESTNATKFSKTGVVRASRVVDNRHVATGNMKKSKFRQNWGERTEPGLLMVEKNDFGYGGSFGYEFGKVQGLYWKADVLMGRAWHFPIANLYLTISGAYETKSFKASGITYNNQKLLRYTYTFAYPVYFGHNINIKPFGGLCAEGLRDKTSAPSGVKSSAWILGMDITYGFQSYLELYGGATYYGFYDYSGWEDFYKNRSGLAFRFGVRFSF